MSQLENTIKLWKEKGIDHAHFVFSCGGDSMNDTHLEYYDEKHNIIDGSELDDYFDNVVYQKVQFYEASDGYYIGEFGQVYIQLDDDDEDNIDFTYSKESTSEYSESYTEDGYMKVSEAEETFLLNKIDNINGSDWDRDIAVNYKGESIFSDEEEEMEKDLLERIQNFVDKFLVEVSEGEREEEGTSFTTGEEGEIEVINGELKLSITQRFLIQQIQND